MKSKINEVSCQGEKEVQGKEDERVLVSIGINPMVFVAYKLVLKVLTNFIFISYHTYLIELCHSDQSIGEK